MGECSAGLGKPTLREWPGFVFVSPEAFVEAQQTALHPVFNPNEVPLGWPESV